MPSTSRYLNYTPWGGQLNNTRMCFEVALVLAVLSSRTLVIPPDYRWRNEPEFVDGRYRPLHPAEFLEFETITRALTVITHDEYLAMTDPESRADSAELIFTPGSCVFCHPHIPRPDSLEASRLVDFAAGRTQFLELTPEMQDRTVLNVQAPTLETFYTFFFFSSQADEFACRRFIRDYVRFKPAILTLGGGLAASLGSFSALHIRRNDFFWQFPEQDLPARAILNRLPAHLRTQLYIASDEPNRQLLAPLREHFEIRFLEDLTGSGSVTAGLPSDWLACVEQVICAQAREFVGTRLSTFSGYITRLRGYQQADDLGFYFTDGPPGGELDLEGAHTYSWNNWLRCGYPLWGREFREGWECGA